MPKLNLNMSRADFRAVCDKALTIAAIAASWTPWSQDDDGVALLQSVVADDVQFGKLCDILGLPPDVPPAA